MSRNLLVALAAATILSGAMLGNSAAAMVPATPSPLGVAATHSGLVRQVTVVCGSNGCVRVQTSRVRRHKRQPRPIR